MKKILLVALAISATCAFAMDQAAAVQKCMKKTGKDEATCQQMVSEKMGGAKSKAETASASH